MKYPKITVITPNYNLGAYLEYTILSVINQNYPNLEYIIIDGGSTDNSVDIIKKYANQLTYWVSEPDKGMYDAIAKGISRSTGDIIAWLNSDDVYILNSLFLVGKIFHKHPEMKCITGNPTFIDENGSIIFSTHPIRPSKITFLNAEYRWIQQESTFFRKACLNHEVLEKFRTFKYAGDFYLWFHFLTNGVCIIPFLTTFSSFRYRQDQLSVSIDEYLNEVHQVLEEGLINLDQQTRKKIKKYKILKLLIGSIPGVRSMNFFRNYLDRLAGRPEAIKLSRTYFDA